MHDDPSWIIYQMSLQLTYSIETNDILLLNRNKLCRTNAMIEVTNKYEKSVGTIIIVVVSQYRGITIHHGILINTHRQEKKFCTN